MDDTSKYLIRAAITADGVVERSDVVGAVFGQTEGLLGDDLDLRDLQQASKVGRIDVEISSENGQSFGHVTIASSLDKVETAILAASLETITRVGPCRAVIEVTDIQDVRAAKRREVVDRAKELLAESFDDSVMTSSEILEEVRESVRVGDVVEYEGLPAGPRIEDSDAIIVVEGRADVLTLLRYGIKNAVAVEGTNIPEAVADLSQERTVTTFLDGDRGGELILRELAQVGSVDYVAFAPDGRSVEDLDRGEVMAALRGKVRFDRLPDSGSLREAVSTAGANGGGGTDPRTGSSGETDSPAAPARTDEAAGGDTEAGEEPDAGPTRTEDATTADGTPPGIEAETGGGSGAAVVGTAADAGTGEVDDGAAAGAAADRDDPATADADAEDGGGPATAREENPAAGDEAGGDDGGGAATDVASLPGHVRAVVGENSGRLRLLDADFGVVTEAPAEDAFDAVNDAAEPPFAVVLDGEVSQRLLDVAAQRGVEHVVGRSRGEFVKRPVDVRVRTADQFRADA
jgi:hypothetical protein